MEGKEMTAKLRVGSCEDALPAVPVTRMVITREAVELWVRGCVLQGGSVDSGLEDMRHLPGVCLNHHNRVEITRVRLVE